MSFATNVHHMSLDRAGTRCTLSMSMAEMTQNVQLVGSLFFSRTDQDDIWKKTKPHPPTHTHTHTHVRTYVTCEQGEADTPVASSRAKIQQLTNSLRCLIPPRSRICRNSCRLGLMPDCALACSILTSPKLCAA